MNREELLDRVKAAVRAVEPDAEIILYGSRSRGEFVADSDWDFLILVSGRLDDSRVDAVRHRLYEVEWESGEVISSIVRSLEQWHSDLYQSIPFHQQVEQEGIRL
jgi:predicted nucleotidyltransferase